MRFALGKKGLTRCREVRWSDAPSIADIIWSIKVLRLDECGDPFRQNFPALHVWFSRISRRPAFQSEVMSHHRTPSRVFKAKAAAENLFRRGLKRASRKLAADASA